MRLRLSNRDNRAPSGCERARALHEQHERLSGRPVDGRHGTAGHGRARRPTVQKVIAETALPTFDGAVEVFGYLQLLCRRPAPGFANIDLNFPAIGRASSGGDCACRHLSLAAPPTGGVAVSDPRQSIATPHGRRDSGPRHSVPAAPRHLPS